MILTIKGKYSFQLEDKNYYYEEMLKKRSL